MLRNCKWWIEWGGKIDNKIYNLSHFSMNYILIWLKWLFIINKHLLLPVFFLYVDEKSSSINQVLIHHNSIYLK